MLFGSPSPVDDPVGSTVVILVDEGSFWLTAVFKRYEVVAVQRRSRSSSVVAKSWSDRRCQA